MTKKRARRSKKKNAPLPIASRRTRLSEFRQSEPNPARLSTLPPKDLAKAVYGCTVCIFEINKEIGAMSQTDRDDVTTFLNRILEVTNLLTQPVDGPIQEE